MLSIKPAIKIKLDSLGEQMKTLRLGMSLVMLAVLNGGYEAGTEKWELSDEMNFDLETDGSNPLKATVTYRKDADTGVSTTVSFKCDADQDEGKEEVAELMAVGTIVGLADDATVLALQFEGEGDTAKIADAQIREQPESEAENPASIPPYNYDPPQAEPSRDV